MKIAVDSPEHTRRRLYGLICHPSRGVTKNRFLGIKQVVMRTSGITAMPRLILRVSTCNLSLVFEPHVQTNGKPASFSFFCRQVMVASFLLFRVIVSIKPLEQKKEGVGAGFPFVGWCMINIVSKNHIQTRKIQRGIAKQRLCQHLT